MNQRPSDWIMLMVKYKGKCKECGKENSFGEYALWSKASKTIKHIRDVIYNTNLSYLLLLSCHILYAEDVLDVSIAYMNQTVIRNGFSSMYIRTECS